jgi:hypothetical protein
MSKAWFGLEMLKPSLRAGPSNGDAFGWTHLRWASRVPPGGARDDEESEGALEFLLHSKERQLPEKDINNSTIQHALCRYE